MIGTIFGRYEVEAVLGSGGMGDVYRARHRQLNRPVALKFVPKELAQTPGRLERFMHEARSLAALNHPNIVTVYDVEEANGRHFIAMELVEGRTLTEAIPAGGLPLRDLLHLGVQVADALAAAHGQGVVHRDLKPGNVMVGDEDRVKVIDFGLAKLLPDMGAETGGVGTSQDVTAPLTGEGRILGTPAYMSPEQVEGRDVDHRADLFSLGVLLYEMSTGKRPFAGDSAISVISSIIKDAPAPVREHRPELPPELERIVRRCLNKNPRERVQTALDVRNELKDLQTEILSGQSGERLAIPVRRSPALPVGLGLAATAVTVLLLLFRPWEDGSVQDDPRSSPALHALAAFETDHAYRFVNPQPWSFDPEPEGWPAVSPDGKQLAFSRTVNGFDKIFVQPLDRSAPPRQVTFPLSGSEPGQGTEVRFPVGALANRPVTVATDTDDVMPTWSGDGNVLAFVRAADPTGQIVPTDSYGGWYPYSECDIWLLQIDDSAPTAEPLVRGAAHPTFHTNGLIAFGASISGSSRIWVSDSRGRGLRQVTEDPDPVIHVEPSWSPDGRKIAFRRQIEKYTARIAVVDLETHKTTDLTADYYLSEPAWSASGNYIYFTASPSSGFNLWRVPVNVEGEATGNIEPVTVGAGRDLSPTLTPDATDLFYSQISWNSDIWIMPVDPTTGLTNGPPRPLIQSSREDTRASWSLDERWLAFTSDREGLMNLYVAPFDPESGTAGRAHRITSGPGGDYQAQWAPEGNKLFYFAKRGGNEDIWVVDLDDQKQTIGEPRRLTNHAASDTNPFVSPDGKWIAFHSDRNGLIEVWLMSSDGTGPTNLYAVRAGGHFIPWYDETSYVASRRRFFLDGREPEPILWFGGGHLQLSPDRSQVLENNHKKIYVGPAQPEGSGEDFEVLVSYEESKISVDYTVWSPSGKWVLFDRNEPTGGDIYWLEGIE